MPLRAKSANPKATRSVRASSEMLGGIMQTGHELFVHGLTDMLDGERQLVEALQKLSDDSSNEQLKKAFASHRKETERQIERLTQCFELLGETPEDTECKGLKGLIAEKEAFMEEEPESDILDVFQVGAAIKAETYEICEYKSLIEMAGEMGHTKVARLLRENLAEERAALKKMEGFSKKLKPNEMMTAEQEERSQAASGKSTSKRAA
jgi:Mn-containing catalase